MRFDEITKVHYLNEQDDMTDEQIKQIIQRDCAPYLREVGDKHLFRGMPVNKQFLKKRTRLADRDPVDTPVELHKMINAYFVKEFKKPFRNAMFCTGKLSDATKYGIAYKVYPIGKFEYLWSPTIIDLWHSYNKNKGEIQDQLIAAGYSKNDVHTPDFIHKKYELFIKDVVVGAFKHNEGLQQAIEADMEVMVWCEEYYAVRNHG